MSPLFSSTFRKFQKVMIVLQIQTHTSLSLSVSLEFLQQSQKAKDGDDMANPQESKISMLRKNLAGINFGMNPAEANMLRKVGTKHVRCSLHQIWWQGSMCM